MPNKNAAKKQPKVTDAERHTRFKKMAKEVEASEDPQDFEKAFTKITAPPKGAKRGGS